MNTSSEKRVIHEAVYNLSTKIKKMHNITISPEKKEEIVSFLRKQNIQNGVSIVFLKHAPECAYDYTEVKTGDYALGLSYGKNNRKSQYKYLLSVSIRKTTTGRFKDFWENRNLPASLLPEITKVLTLFDEDIFIHTFSDPLAWNERRKMEHEKYLLIGKAPHVKSGKFITTLPIGYIVPTENHIRIFSPSSGEHVDRAENYFHFKL